MKLLIITQAVDTNDSVLGFFVRWIEEFSKHCEKVTVLCLREGEYSLPSNVEVYELRPYASRSGLRAAFNFYRYVFRLRSDYDTVFVHMNPEYVVLGGLLWRLFGKRSVLWYTHKSVDLKLRVATLFAHDILTASRESFRLRTKKLHVMGHGIDTDFFTPISSLARGSWYLSVGRLTKSKRHDLAIDMAANERRDLRIVGAGPEQKALEAYAFHKGAHVHFLGGLSQSALRDEYRHAALLVHMSETGSLDKVTLEALACGLHFRTNDPALKSIENESPEYVRAHHSLGKLIESIIGVIRRV